MQTRDARCWTRRIGEHVVHADSDEHVELVTRTLGIDEAAWSTTLDTYLHGISTASTVGERLHALGVAFRAVAPHEGAIPARPPASCACCGERCSEPEVARQAGLDVLLYGRCTACGHGQLLSGAASDPYAGAEYYRRRERDGSGYADYAADRAYREAKATRLFHRVESKGVRARSVLEVGSGFGYACKAARDRGMSSLGVDVNPAAADAARALYGFDTFVGTLAEALDRGVAQQASFDLVLYQFVLEHLDDPRAELAHATRALAPGGHLLLVVPSMSTFELDVFGASYRSLRGDHLHLFSARSLRRFLQEAGLSLVSLDSHCSVHLVRGFLTPGELDELYRAGQGPDLTALARWTPP